MSFAELEYVFLFWELPGGRWRWAGYLGGSDSSASWPCFARACLGPSGIKIIVGSNQAQPEFVTSDMVRDKVFTHLHQLILQGRCRDLIGLEEDLHGILGIVGPGHLFRADCGIIGVELLRILLCRPDDAQALVIDPEDDPLGDEKGSDERLPSIPQTVLTRCKTLAVTAPRERAQREFFILENGKLLQPTEEVAGKWKGWDEHYEKLNKDPNLANRLFMCLEFLARLPPYGQGLKGGEPEGVPVWPENPGNKKA